MPPPDLSDREVHDLFHEVGMMLHGKRAASVHGMTAIQALQRQVQILQFAILAISERADAERVIDPPLRPEP